MSKVDDELYLLWSYVHLCRNNSKKEDVQTLCWVSGISKRVNTAKEKIGLFKKLNNINEKGENVDE